MSTIPKIVLDIETAGDNFDDLDEISKEYLLKYTQGDEEQKTVKESLAFYPLTGKVVVIGALNPDTGRAQLLSLDDKKSGKTEKIDDNADIVWGTEKEILQKFWDLALSYKTFVTFNGRGFDIPYLMVRSAVYGITPSKNLMANKYTSYQKDSALHIDLADQLSFYGAVRRKFSLHMWCRTFGIDSPKEEGVRGEDVTGLFNEGKIVDVAKYNLRDLKATALLYDKWNEYLNI